MSLPQGVVNIYHAMEYSALQLSLSEKAGSTVRARTRPARLSTAHKAGMVLRLDMHQYEGMYCSLRMSACHCALFRSSNYLLPSLLGVCTHIPNPIRNEV